MDPRLLRYYNQELRYLREMGAEFAREFPKIAGRLGMEGMEVADPYVERLIEGCAFLAARVQLKQDAEFPQPVAAAARDDLSESGSRRCRRCWWRGSQCANDPNLRQRLSHCRAAAPLIGAATALSRTRCEFRTAQDVRAHAASASPAAEYFLSAADLGLSNLPAARAAAQRRAHRGCELPAGLAFNQLKIGVAALLHRRPAGRRAAPARADGRRLRRRARRRAGPRRRRAPGSSSPAPACVPAGLRRRGGDAAGDAARPGRHAPAAGVLRLSAALPVHRHRRPAARCSPRRPATRSRSCCSSIATAPALEGAVEAGNFQLHCVPAINLFRAPRRPAPISTTARHAFHVVPERTAPLDYEVFDMLGVRGFRRGRRGASSSCRCSPRRRPSRGRPTAYYSAGASRGCLSDRGKREGPALGLHRLRGLPLAGRPARAPVPRARCASSACRRAARTATCRCSCRPAQAQGELTLDITAAGRSRSRIVAGPSRPAQRDARGRRSRGACSACCRSTTCRCSTPTRRRARRRCARSCRCSRSAPTSALKRQIEGVRSIERQARSCAAIRSPGRSPSAAASRSR